MVGGLSDFDEDDFFHDELANDNGPDVHDFDSRQVGELFSDDRNQFPFCDFFGG